MQPPVIPPFLMGRTPLDFSPITNALAQFDASQRDRRNFEEKQRQFNMQNALAQGRFGLEQGRYDRETEDRARAEQQREQVRQYLATGQFGNVPPELVGVSRATNSVDPVKDFILAKAKREAEGQFGKQGAAYFDPGTGRSYTIQFGANGERRILPVEAPGGVALNPDRGVKTVDTGTGTRIIDGARGGDVREINKDIVGRERAEALGKASGAAQADLQRILDTSTQTLDLIKKIEGAPGTAANFGLQGYVPNRPGGAAADAKAMIEQLGGQAFLQAFNSLKGGGAITEVEGAKATNAIARLQTAQSFDAFKAALADLKGVIETGRRRAMQSAGIPEPRQQTTGSSNAIPRVMSDADFDALPSGTTFIDPNGYKRVKP